jgi:hypothetical protein
MTGVKRLWRDWGPLAPRQLEVDDFLSGDGVGFAPPLTVRHHNLRTRHTLSRTGVDSWRGP